MNLSSRQRRLLCFLPAVLLAGGLTGAAPATNWAHWRGPAENGSAPNDQLPQKIDAAQVLWQAALPGKGSSTPIVWNQRIYLTAPAEGKDALIAFDWNGKLLWQTPLGPENPGKHRNGSGSNPSPVTDGQRVFVTFKSGHLAALDLEGKILWSANLSEKFGPVKMFWDFGTSPVLTEKNVVLARMHDGESWLAAFDKATGELRWKTDRTYRTPREVDQG